MVPQLVMHDIHIVTSCMFVWEPLSWHFSKNTQKSQYLRDSKDNNDLVLFIYGDYRVTNYDVRIFGKILLQAVWERPFLPTFQNWTSPYLSKQWSDFGFEKSNAMVFQRLVMDSRTYNYLNGLFYDKNDGARSPQKWFVFGYFVSQVTSHVVQFRGKWRLASIEKFKTDLPCNS